METIKTMKFIVDGDVHFSADGIRQDKQEYWNDFLESLKIKSKRPDFILLVGDLTNHGWDGKNIHACNWSWNYGGKEDEFTPFLKQYVEPLKHYGVDLYAIYGNHDTYVPWPYLHKPVCQWVIKNYNGNKYGCYTFQKEELLFVMLGMYPNKDTLPFLIKSINHTDCKNFCVAFHYNLEGPYSDWWSNDEKFDFYMTLQDIEMKTKKNCIGIFNGHYHVSRNYTWGLNSEFKTYEVFMGSGSKFMECIYDGKKIQMVEND